jgi:hypothetical protein
MTARSLVWIEGDAEGGWACSICRWRSPIPTLLTGQEARDAYDRLAVAKFNEHKCQREMSPPSGEQNAGSNFTDRARGLIMRGYKPKVAVEVLMTELEFEYRNDSSRMEKARAEAEEFLLKVRKGLI